MAKTPLSQAERARTYRARHPERARMSSRKWKAANPEQVATYNRKYRASPEKRRAHQAVYDAIKGGRLERGLCECAGDDCLGRIEAHHDDYSKPLDVRWFCKAHHAEAHRVY